MIHDDDEPPSVQDEVKQVTISAVGKVFSDKLVYQHEKVGLWVDQICGFCVQDCNSLPMRRKYVAHCTIMQRSGAGVHNATSVFWDTEADGYYSYTVQNKTMICTTTLYGLAL
eukprot:TRINITY_DN40421_c0_g1_i1.p1 TRINITY_DN40421_c0_g1~~TRINITY_DN40421_c0_g1_i1.p1  ORF type:complete len:113 (+),score=30.74 TRINITY_DN40421_c0_g1_i1:109-447(+)